MPRRKKLPTASQPQANRESTKGMFVVDFLLVFYRVLSWAYNRGCLWVIFCLYEGGYPECLPYLCIVDDNDLARLFC